MESYKQEGRKINNDPGKGIMTARSLKPVPGGLSPQGAMGGSEGLRAPGHTDLSHT